MDKNRHDSRFMTLLQMKRKSPEEVAEVLGVTVRAVYFWISGHREPRLTIKQTQDLCTFLDCSVHELPEYFGPTENAPQESDPKGDMKGGK